LKSHHLESKHGRRKLAKNIYTAEKECYIAENMIKGKTATTSNQICQMDASEFKYLTGKLIVEGIIDIYDKTVVIEYGDRENKELVSETIKKRIEMGIPEKLHSDRGAANASLKVKEELEKNGIIRSMSAPHSPNENQYIETFWKSAKTEIGDTRKLTCEQLKMVLDYYDHYYNDERIHSSIDYLTPNQKRCLSLA
jgi:transposase InsO family protein